MIPQLFIHLLKMLNYHPSVTSLESDLQTFIQHHRLSPIPERGLSIDRRICIVINTIPIIILISFDRLSIYRWDGEWIKFRANKQYRYLTHTSKYIYIYNDIGETLYRYNPDGSRILVDRFELSKNLTFHENQGFVATGIRTACGITGIYYAETDTKYLYIAKRHRFSFQPDDADRLKWKVFDIKTGEQRRDFISPYVTRLNDKIYEIWNRDYTSFHRINVNFRLSGRHITYWLNDYFIFKRLGEEGKVFSLYDVNKIPYMYAIDKRYLVYLLWINKWIKINKTLVVNIIFPRIVTLDCRPRL